MLKKYIPFFKAGSMNAMAYKSALLFWFLVTILNVLCIIFLWNAVYSSSTNPVINGFTFKGIIAYFVFVNILSFVNFPGETLWSINQDIQKGTICMAFTKPISYRVKFSFMNLGLVFTPFIILGLPLYIIAYVVFSILGYIPFISIPSMLFSIFMFFILQILGILIADAIDYFFGILCFYTSSGWGLSQLKQVIQAFFGGTLLPLSFFKFGDFDASIIVNYMPFACLIQNPVLALLREYKVWGDYLETIKTLGLAILWLIILECINKILFSHASKKVTVQGG